MISDSTKIGKSDSRGLAMKGQSQPKISGTETSSKDGFKPKIERILRRFCENCGKVHPRVKSSEIDEIERMYEEGCDEDELKVALQNVYAGRQGRSGMVAKFGSELEISGRCEDCQFVDVLRHKLSLGGSKSASDLSEAATRKDSTGSPLGNLLATRPSSAKMSNGGKSKTNLPQLNINETGTTTVEKAFSRLSVADKSPTRLNTSGF